MKIECRHCKSKDIVKKGFRQGRFGKVQKYYCKECNGYFSLKDIAGKVYGAKKIMKALSLYNTGLKQKEIAGRIKVSQSSVSAWVNEFKDVCSYYRIRKRVQKICSNRKRILKKIFHHHQPYKYLMHNGKMELFVNKYFAGLKGYLVNVVSDCPDQMFNSEKVSRCSQLKIDHKPKVELKGRSHACKLANLALRAVKDNRQRHSVLQEFMLHNDTVTVACEVPVWLNVEEMMKYNVFRKKNFASQNSLVGSRKSEVGSGLKLSNEVTNGLQNSKNFEKARGLKEAEKERSVSNFVSGVSGSFKGITGHIDMLQVKFGRIYVLDFKPEAAKEKDAWCQVFAYALALSERTGVWLRNFRCAWFDDLRYYEFDPCSVVLGFDPKMPDWKKKEFAFDDKAGLFYTSKYFQKVRNERKVSGKERLHERYFGKLGYKEDVR